MTVQELIDELSTIEDKSLRVELCIAFDNDDDAYENDTTLMNVSTFRDKIVLYNWR